MVMETTMYEDETFSRESLKRKLTLDLSQTRSVKRQKGAGTAWNTMLTSPDLNMLKVATPELEHMILHGVSSTPNPLIGNQMKTPTVEEFTQGFDQTLEKVRQSKFLSQNDPHLITTTTDLVVPCKTVVVTSGLQFVTPPTCISLASTQPQVTSVPVHTFSACHHEVPVTVTEDIHEELVKIKEEPQMVPCGSTPPRSPINMEDQEMMKLERKRQRNRIAASKCRRRKLERISTLEDKVTNLKTENTKLQQLANRLKDQVCSLKQEVMDHVKSGCQISFATSH